MAVFKEEFITNELGFQNNEPIKWAEDFAKIISGNKKDKNKVTSSQIRNFFGKIKSIQMEGYSKKNKPDLLMIKAHLAYATKRAADKNPNSKMPKLKAVITDAIDLIIDSANNDKTEKIRFKNFINLVEAIVAYHKVYGEE